MQRSAFSIRSIPSIDLFFYGGRKAEMEHLTVPFSPPRVSAPGGLRKWGLQMKKLTEAFELNGTVYAQAKKISVQAHYAPREGATGCYHAFR